MSLSGGSYTGHGVFLGDSDWFDLAGYLAGECILSRQRAAYLGRRVREQLPEPLRPRTHLVDPVRAAERALGGLPSTLDPDTAAIIEAIKELAHGLAALARSGDVAKR